MTIGDIGTNFVRLGLGIDRHFPGYVDSYYGPAHIPQAIHGEGQPSLLDLEVLANSLAGQVATEPSLPPTRREVLLGEIAAMYTTLRILQGESPDIKEEVRLLYGVIPAWVDEATFAHAHRALAAILPGSDPLAARVHAFRERLRLPVEVAAPLIKLLAAELRERTRARFDLPEHEICDFTFVREQPWVAYNWYLGAGRSRIEFNTDHPIYIHQLPHIVAHESYAGHHTEHAIKEEKLYRQEGHLEWSILLNNTPSALMSEGIAQSALQVIAESEERVAIYRDLLGAAGRPIEEAQRVHDFTMAARPLNRVTDNQLLLLHGEGASDEDVIAYGVHHALSTEEDERRSMQFFKDPLSRSYGFNYTLGQDIVEAFLCASANKLEAFARLLQEPMTPGQIVAATGK